MNIIANSVLSLVFLSVVVIVTQVNTYTVEDAESCFHQKALKGCSNVIGQCMMREQCREQLMSFQDCGFERQHQDQVFNGNCFLNWQQTATHSKQVIKCLDQHCSLSTYNSQISLPTLYSCSAEALLSANIDCDQHCQSVLRKLVSDKIPYLPIKEIYEVYTKEEQDGNSESAMRIVEVIARECVDKDGSVRRHQQERIAAKRGKQQQRINSVIMSNINQSSTLQQDNQQTVDKVNTIDPSEL